MNKILIADNVEEDKFLRQKTKEFDFDKYSKKEIDNLIKKMRRMMNDANGIGLAANQIGLDVRVFVAQWDGKFYAFFNPRIEDASKETEILEQGCLSLPGRLGEVERPEKITLVAQNKQGKKVKVKAWGMLSHIFQHEVDHLEGKLYIDRMRKGAELIDLRREDEDEYQFVFFGSPNIAAIILRRLVEAGMAPKYLVCNPDKPVGRKKVMTPPETKQLVLENNWPIEIYQPENKEELGKVAKQLLAETDLGVVAAYGKLLPYSAIQESPLGVVGVHPSLLPLHRGPSPIRSSILAGDIKTGSTLFLIDEKMDEGPMLAQSEIYIGERNNRSLSIDLAHLSADMLIDVLPRFIAGKVNPKQQEHEKATYTKFFKTEDGYVSPEDLQSAMDGDKDKAFRIDRMIRALGEEPGVYTMMNGKRTKLLKALVDEDRLVLKTIQKEGKKPTAF